MAITADGKMPPPKKAKAEASRTRKSGAARFDLGLVVALPRSDGGRSPTCLSLERPEIGITYRPRGETAAAPGFALWQQIGHKLDAGR